MAIYEVIITDPATGKIWELFPKSYSFSEKLNAESNATFNLSFEEVENLAERNGTTVINIFTAALREIYINRNGTKIFYGVITNFDVGPGDAGEKNVVVKAMGFFGLFKKRIVGKGTEVRYTGIDAGQIAWDLIDDSQNYDLPYSDWGITQGSITASVNRDRGYLFDVIYDQIIALSNENLENGFDFDIDNTKAFNVYYPTKGILRNTVVFDERTMSNWKYEKVLILGMTNHVLVIGEGFNDVILYGDRTAGTSYRTPFGSLEEKVDARNVNQQTTLDDKGDRELLLKRDPVIRFVEASHFDDTIAYTDYNLGDTIIVNMPDLGVNNEQKRIIERSFTMQSPESIAKITNKLRTP